MTDGLVIMAIGMGVVFAFLVILMIFIRLLGMRDALAATAVTPDQRATHPAPEETSTGDAGAARAAAIAVALELAGRRVGSASPRAAADPGAAWRASGRASLHQGPQAVSAVLTSRRQNQ